MKTNAAGRALIKEFEGYETLAYPDPGSMLARELAKAPHSRMPNWMCLPGDPWTIGIGATGKGIGPGVLWTDDQVLERFEHDLTEREALVAKYVSATLNENQFAAMVSFFFNVKLNSILHGGPHGGVCTLLAKLNRGDYLGSAAEFVHWVYAGKHQVSGLHRRRAAEQALFLLPPELKLVA